ncbi:MAG TPA: hypothetical protein VHZ50_16515 [Puia sp.]|jgi:hypothetical protein|nr:hypothetical protein [Puia sp.]
MIEIINFREIKKGCLDSKISVKIKEWGFVINRIAVFNKDGKRWISLPSEMYEDNGEKKYFSLVKFDDQKNMTKFQDSVLEELDKYCDKNKENPSVFGSAPKKVNEIRKEHHQDDLPF